MATLKKSFLFVLLWCTISCGDNVSLKENDLEKYPWLSSFINEIEYTAFKGHHNIDLGTLDFEYTILEENGDKALLQFDNIAENEQWDILTKEELERTYLKISQEDSIVMRVEFDKIHDKLIFKIK